MKTWSEVGIDVPATATGNVHVKCPFCPPRKPQNRNDRDLSVNVEEGVWQCHHCEAKGSLGKDNGYIAPKVYQRPKEIVAAPDTVQSRMNQWFASRKISYQVVERNRITAISGQKEWIAFPYFRDGEHINTTYRQFPEKAFRQEKDAERIFYGLDDITETDDTLIICEGQIDKLSFEMAGYKNCLSVPDGALQPGAKVSDQKLSYLASAQPLFDRMRRVYIASDSDAPGQALAQELSHRIGREKCWMVEWPEGIKDANDALTTIGPAAIQEAVEVAKPYPIQGIWYASSLAAEIKHTYRHGYDPGVKSGLGVFDNHYRVIKGMVTIVTGWSSHGKSTWLDHFVMALAKNHGWRIGICSPENQPISDHAARLAEIYVGKAFDLNIGNRMTEHELDKAVEWIDDHLSFILPETTSLDAILANAKTVLFQKGLDGLIIDPWNEIEHNRPPNKTETEYISESLTTIRKWARTNNVKVWVLVHPAKPGQGQTITEAPEMYQISGSNHWWNKADYGISIWRNPKDNDVWSEAHIKKIRFKPTGKVGIVDFRVNYATRTLETREHPEEVK